jgi:hypothetical protein
LSLRLGNAVAFDADISPTIMMVTLNDKKPSIETQLYGDYLLAAKMRHHSQAFPQYCMIVLLSF